MGAWLTLPTVESGSPMTLASVAVLLPMETFGAQSQSCWLNQRGLRLVFWRRPHACAFEQQGAI